MKTISLNVSDDFVSILSLVGGWSAVIDKEIPKTEKYTLKEENEANLACQRIQHDELLTLGKIDREPNGFVINYTEKVEVDNPVSQENAVLEVLQLNVNELYKKGKIALAQHYATVDADEQVKGMGAYFVNDADIVSLSKDKMNNEMDLVDNSGIGVITDGEFTDSEDNLTAQNLNQDTTEDDMQDEAKD